MSTNKVDRIFDKLIQPENVDKTVANIYKAKKLSKYKPRVSFEEKICNFVA